MLCHFYCVTLLFSYTLSGLVLLMFSAPFTSDLWESFILLIS